MTERGLRDRTAANRRKRPGISEGNGSFARDQEFLAQFAVRVGIRASGWHDAGSAGKLSRGDLLARQGRRRVYEDFEPATRDALHPFRVVARSSLTRVIKRS